jgi:hypothetical protein
LARSEYANKYAASKRVASSKETLAACSASDSPQKPVIVPVESATPERAGRAAATRASNAARK